MCLSFVMFMSLVFCIVCTIIIVFFFALFYFGIRLCLFLIVILGFFLWHFMLFWCLFFLLGLHLRLFFVFQLTGTKNTANDVCPRHSLLFPFFFDYFFVLSVLLLTKTPVILCVLWFVVLLLGDGRDYAIWMFVYLVICFGFWLTI